MVNKYWNYGKGRLVHQPSPLRNSAEPLHVVTHRAIGDIPGCTPAPREHTFRPSSLEENQAITGARADEWCSHVMKYVNGEYGGNSGLEDMWSAISRIKPMFGPHGEKL